MLDHDHDTALVRGYLCRSCNGLEPGGGDASVFGKYRRRNPASMLGHEQVYVDPVRGRAVPASTEDEQFEQSLRASSALGALFG